jgi:NADP-dependent 3-hydroxy acid dehydrogenase YdfG
MNMEHKTVLVTGANSGIGFAAAGVRPHDVELARRLWQISDELCAARNVNH